MLATNFPIWSLTCGQPDMCDEGCDASCDFHAAHPRKVVPLSQHNSRLTLVFSGTAAQWSLSWGLHSPSEHVVFALFTRSPGKAWELRHQTADFGASLDDLSSGSDMKLVAVAESGVLSVIITPYAPPAHPKGVVKPALGMPLTQATRDRAESNDIDVGDEGAWPLLHEAEVEASGLVAAKVWWPPLSPRGADYLVTWEVEGGGLKGHLYTDLPEVDLTLWPETVYQVQVEVMTGPVGHPLRSAHLTLDTHNITLAAHARKNNRLMPTLPLVHKAEPPMSLEMLLGAGAGVLAALLLLVGLVWRRARAAAIGHTATATPAKWGTWNRTLADVTLDESLVVKGNKAAEGEAGFSAVTRPHQGPVFTLAPPAHSNPSHSILSFSRPAHTHVNLYSVVPPLQERCGQVTKI
ncbi:uncharacterized protein LOC126998981 isoform X2 [Eriocheir sinensis]|nr:uncharacterized protein LOC126998981 isoform X2 [Eriocheir sinensis]